MSATIPFDNTQLPYDPTLVIQDGLFNAEAYQAYSPVFVPITLAMGYALAFASTTGVFVHPFCSSFSSMHRSFDSLNIFL